MFVEGHTADYDHNKACQRTDVAKSCNDLFRNASFECVRDEDGNQYESVPNGGDARYLSHGYIEGIRVERFKQNILR